MRESITYREILDEGRSKGLVAGRNEGLVEGKLEEARRLVLSAGVRRLGTAGGAARARVEEINSLDVLEALLPRIFDVETWDDLLTDVPDGA